MPFHDIAQHKIKWTILQQDTLKGVPQFRKKKIALMFLLSKFI